MTHKDTPDTKEITKTKGAGEIDRPLSAEEFTFTRLLAKGYTYTKAYRMSFPTAKDYTNDTVRRKASELATKSNIQSEVATARQTQAHLARLAEERIEEALTSGKDGMATNQVAMFMYDHANGKATIKAEVKSAHVSVVYDLSGGQAGAVPQEILDQLTSS